MHQCLEEPKEGAADGPTDGQTDGPTECLIEVPRGRKMCPRRKEGKLPTDQAKTSATKDQCLDEPDGPTDDRNP